MVWFQIPTLVYSSLWLLSIWFTGTFKTVYSWTKNVLLYEMYPPSAQTYLAVPNLRLAYWILWHDRDSNDNYYTTLFTWPRQHLFKKFSSLVSGLAKLTNEKRGDFYGVAYSWSSDKRLSLGFALLYRSFKIFLFEGERQLRPLDLKTNRKWIPIACTGSIRITAGSEYDGNRTTEKSESQAF